MTGSLHPCGQELDDTPSLLAQIEAAVRLDARVVEALRALSAERTVQAATAQLGVSERTLQRLLKPATGRAPVYWKRLARLRQTARALSHGPAGALADVACAQGFADQAHMSREIRSWLGVSPGQLQQRSSLLYLLNEPGFGNESAGAAN
ncbi:MAG: helix-turn-helix domain-containing protein [Burkholderiaceae bacterium]